MALGDLVLPAAAGARVDPVGGEDAGASGPPGRPPLTAHRDDIQGLRAVAVLLVVLGHAGVGFVQGGFVGVDVFFVLSGFLITGLLLGRATARGGVSLAEFYVRRGRRILPAAALTLVVTDLVAYRLLNFVRARAIAQDSIWASLFGANIHFAQLGTDYFARGQPPSPVQHFWSLAVEEQFYLAWPLLVGLALFGTALAVRMRRLSAGPFPGPAPAGLRRLGILVAVIGIGSLAWSIYYTGSVPAAAFFSTPARAWELAVGAALAIGAAGLYRLPGRARAVMGWVGLAGIGVAGVLFSSDTPFPGYAALLPTLAAALVIGAGVGGGRTRGVGRVLGVAPLRYVGDRSYALYLWHWPVLTIAAAYAGHALSVGVNLLLLAGAFLLSAITYRCFENPIRRGQPIAGDAVGWLRERLAPYGLGFSRPESGRSTVRGLQIWPASALAVLVVATFTVSAADDRASRLEATATPATPGFTPVTPVGSPTGVSGPTPGVGAGTGTGTGTGAGAPAGGTDPAGSVALGQAGQALPAVVAAVQAARRGAPIPAGLTPPVGSLLDANDPDVVYSFPGGCVPATSNQTTSRICRLGDASASRSLVVLGDSHAQMWMPAILKLAAEDGWLVRPIVKSGCGPYTWAADSGIVDAATPVCRAWITWALAQVRSMRPAAILFTGSYAGRVGPMNDASQRGIVALAAAMKGYSKHLVLVADDDGLETQPVDCLLSTHANMGVCSGTPSSDQVQLNGVLAGIAPTSGFGFLDTRGWFCFDGQCPMVVGHTIVYRDLSHVTGVYAAGLAAPFRAGFRQAIGAGAGR